MQVVIHISEAVVLFIRDGFDDLFVNVLLVLFDSLVLMIEYV